MSVSNQIDKVGVDLLKDMSCKNKKGERMVTVATTSFLGLLRLLGLDASLHFFNVIHQL